MLCFETLKKYLNVSDRLHKKLYFLYLHLFQISSTNRNSYFCLYLVFLPFGPFYIQVYPHLKYRKFHSILKSIDMSAVFNLPVAICTAINMLYSL